MNKIKEWLKAQNVDPKVAVNVSVFGILLGIFSAGIYYIFVK